MRTVPYGDHPDQVVDVWDGDGPSVLLLHGGYWRQRYDRSYLHGFAESLARQGFSVASLEYRRTGWPDIFDDTSVGVDRFPGAVLVGHSAGGHLALWSATRHRLPATSRWHRSGPPRVAGVVAVAPVADLAEAGRLGLSDHAVRELLGEPLDTRLAEADPMRLLPLDVPVTVLHGDADDDVPLSLSRRYAAAAGVRLRELPGVDHFQPLTAGHPASTYTVAAIRELAGCRSA